MQLDILPDFDFSHLTIEEDHNDSPQSSYWIKVYNNIVNFVVFFCITSEACPGLPLNFEWSYFWWKIMTGSRCLCSSELPPEFCDDPGHVHDHFRNSDILLHFLWSSVYGSHGAFIVVFAYQWLSIDGGKHIGWISFSNVA